MLLVVDASTTMRGAVKATKEQLELVGSNIVGAVFNNFDPARAKMSYGSYRYHYYASYEYHDGKGRGEDLPKPLQIDPNELWR